MVVQPQVVSPINIYTYWQEEGKRRRRRKRTRRRRGGEGDKSQNMSTLVLLDYLIDDTERSKVHTGWAQFLLRNVAEPIYTFSFAL